ncbi:putative ribonuclease H-like domain-containing protein [Tanacetum coccineum]
MKSSFKTLNTARQSSSRAAVSVNTAKPINTAYTRPIVNSARPTSNVINRAHSHVRRPFNKYTTNKNYNFNEKVNTVRENVTTVGPKAVVSDNKGNEANAVKASACWVWIPKHKLLNHVSRNNDASMSFKRFDYLELQEKGVIDSGCSRHMTGNKSYLSDYEEIDGGFVAFGGNSKEVRLLEKLTDENHVLLKVPRKDNMYNVDLRNVVPQGGLICLFAKATLDEYNLWHRRLGHINFKTMNKLVRGILCDNGTEFKNKEMNQFCEMKGIKREFSVARTPQQNRVAKRKNRTLIEAARTMVLVIKPHNKTPYELFLGRKPALSFMRPFGCPVTILNTLDHLGKFDGKADDGFFVGYSINSKAFRVFNSRTKIVEETLHITFLENKPNVARSGLEWLFDIDTLTKSMNYKPVFVWNQTNGNADDKVVDDVEKKSTEDPGKEDDKDDRDLREFKSSPVNTIRTKDAYVNNTNSIYTASPLINFDGLSYFNANLPDDPKMPNLEDTDIFGGAYDDEDFVARGDIIRDLHSAPQTRRMTKNSEEHVLMSLIQKQRRTNHKDFQNCLFACFLSQVEPKKVIQALTYSSWIEAMQDKLLQFKLQKVWTSVDLPYGKRAIGIKWVYRNKKDKRGIVVRNKARLVAQGYTQSKAMDVKSAFLYGKIEEEVYVFQPPRFEDQEFPNRVYKVEKALYGLHQAPRAWYETLSTYLLENGFQRGTLDKTLFIKKVMQKEDGIFISQDKYVDEILKKFGFSIVRIESTPMETSKPLLKDAEAEDVDVHLYRSMIGSLIIFRYLKGQPKLGLWYPKDSPFDLEAYNDSDYAGTSLDRNIHEWVQQRYVVPTGRVVVPTSRYVVPAGKVIIIVSPGRLNLVPTGRILSPGKVK